MKLDSEAWTHILDPIDTSGGHILLATVFLAAIAWMHMHGNTFGDGAATPLFAVIMYAMKGAGNVAAPPPIDKAALVAEIMAAVGPRIPPPLLAPSPTPAAPADHA